MKETKEHKEARNQIRKEHFDRDRLKAMFLLKGRGSYLSPAAEMLCIDECKVSYKVNNNKLTHEETIMLAKGLELTAREYIDIFCSGVFTENK